MDAKKAYSVKDFMSAFGVCRTTVYAEIKRGNLHAVKYGKRTIIPAKAADGWLASLPEFGAEVR